MHKSLNRRGLALIITAVRIFLYSLFQCYLNAIFISTFWLTLIAEFHIFLGCFKKSEMISGIWNQAWNCAEGTALMERFFSWINCSTINLWHVGQGISVDNLGWSYCSLHSWVWAVFWTYCYCHYALSQFMYSWWFWLSWQKNPTLKSRTLELLAFSDKLPVDSLYAYCLRLLLIANLFCILAIYIIISVYSNWNY